MKTTALSTAAASELRAEMGRQRVTQLELARRVGMNRTTLRAKLLGDNEFSIDELAAVSGALGISLTSLLEPRSAAS